MNLIADIGGTNARFAFVEENSIEPVHAGVVACADFAHLSDAVSFFVEDSPYKMPERACIAIATPVTGDEISMTNHVWQFSISETRQKLDLKQLNVINDYTALSLALPHLSNNDLYMVGGGATVNKQCMAVLGPGTGLGVSGVVYSGSHWVPIQGEGGHIEYKPLDEFESAVLAILKQDRAFISAEDIISGPGLLSLGQSICQLNGEEVKFKTPAEITHAAINDSSRSAVEALNLFCGVLGSVAGDLALTLGARGGVFIGGGIIPRITEFFTASEFRQRFEQKGDFTDYVQSIPTNVIISEYPALTGAALALQPQYVSLGVTSSC